MYQSNELKNSEKESGVKIHPTRQGYRSSKKTSKLKKFINAPKGNIIIILLLLMIAGLYHNNPFHSILNTGLAVLTAVSIDSFMCIVQKRKKITVDGGIISGLILSLILSPVVPWYEVIVISLITIVSKYLFNVQKKPVFNPAAFGLLVANILFSSDQSWWGAMALLPEWFLSILLIGGYLITKKVNKFPQVLTFLGVYFSLFVLISLFHIKDVGEIFRPPFINSTLFLVFFMLTDPPTSPGKYKDQIIFSLISATISVLLYILVGGLSYLLIGLLVANGWKTLNARKVKMVKNKSFQN